MIEEIRIRDLGVITEASLPLVPGLTVVTGETGAGKTMVVTALGLLLGARADSGAVRLGAKAAAVEATMLLPEGHAALQRAEEAGAQYESTGSGRAELLVCRTVAADGRSRAVLGGRSTPISVLAEVGVKLVAVHGQSDQIRLRSTSAQREALDAFAGSSEHRAGAEFRHLLGKYREEYVRWRKDAERLREFRESGAERERQIAELEAALAEISAVGPQPGEDAALKAESLRLSNLESVRLACGQAREALLSEDFGEVQDATTLIDAARRALEQVAEYDPVLDAWAQRLTEAGYLLNDIAAELAGYLASLDTDASARLAATEDRRGELTKLLRRQGRHTVDELLAWAEEAATRLEQMSGGGESLSALERAVEEADTRLVELAGQLRRAREVAAAKLAGEVSAELDALAMPQASLRIKLNGTERGLHGTDEPVFLLQPHPGSPLRPVGKGASGGELSRVMLALEVVLAGVDPVPTFVFDEVDAGVGGKSAVEVGRRLATLARHVQVIVVTHLPQVAAFADHHIRVFKTSDSGLTSSDVTVLDTEARVTELARMLAGQENSQSARAHARELLEQAAKAKPEGKSPAVKG